MKHVETAHLQRLWYRYWVQFFHQQDIFSFSNSEIWSLANVDEGGLGTNSNHTSANLLNNAHIVELFSEKSFLITVSYIHILLKIICDMHSCEVCMITHRWPYEYKIFRKYKPVAISLLLLRFENNGFKPIPSSVLWFCYLITKNTVQAKAWLY